MFASQFFFFFLSIKGKNKRGKWFLVNLFFQLVWLKIMVSKEKPWFLFYLLCACICVWVSMPVLILVCIILHINQCRFKSMKIFSAFCFIVVCICMYILDYVFHMHFPVSFSVYMSPCWDMFLGFPICKDMLVCICVYSCIWMTRELGIYQLCAYVYEHAYVWVSLWFVYVRVHVCLNVYEMDIR